MEYSNTNGIIYHGFAKITTLKNGKKIKTIKVNNNGELLLFKILANVLCGNEISKNRMPRYLDIEDKNGESILINRLSLTAEVAEIKENEKVVGYGAKFTAMLPSFQISTSNSFITINTLKLYSNPNGEDTCLATIDLEESIELEVSNYSHLIEWMMTFENKEKT
jgi:hypothetical protein